MSASLNNPFTQFGQITTSQHFVGRKIALERIKTRLLDTRSASLSVIGMPRIGKSSLVYQAFMTQKNDLTTKGCLPIWINLAIYEDPHDFFRALILSCLDELEKLGRLTDSIQRAADASFQEGSRVDTIFRMRRFFTRVRQENIQVIFILDEFDHASTLFQQNPVVNFSIMREMAYDPDSRITFVTISRRSLRNIEAESGIISSFTGIFFSYYLAVFNEEELQEYFQRFTDVGLFLPHNDEARINFYCGGHPYLLEMLGYYITEHFLAAGQVDVETAAHACEQHFADYYETLVTFLRQDNKLDMLLKTVFGPAIDIEQQDINQLLAYGLIKKNQTYYDAFSAHFRSFLQQIARKVDLWPLLTAMERQLRAVITSVLQSAYGERWPEEIMAKSPHLLEIFNRARQNAQGEEQILGKSSPQLLNYVSLADLFAVIFTVWDLFEPILQKDKSYWHERALLIAKVRNPLAHNRANMIAESHLFLAQQYCEEILAILQAYEANVEQAASDELLFLERVELAAPSVERSIERLRKVAPSLHSNLDRQRLEQLQVLLEIVLDYCQEVTFAGQQRLSMEIDARCQDLLHDIEAHSTDISVKGTYPAVIALQRKTQARQEEIYKNSAPQLTLRLPVESYIPDSNHIITLETPEMKMQQYLEGGEQYISIIPLHVTERAISACAFPILFQVRYHTITGDRVNQPTARFEIHLNQKEQFQEVENPYSTYAEGGIVADPTMFFGRNELIHNLSTVIHNARLQSKAILIYGQKRSGKSSVLFHFQKSLEHYDDLLVLDVGNIGVHLDEHSSIPLLYKFLWAITYRLKQTIESKEKEGRCRLGIIFPTRREFYGDSAPVDFFIELFETFQQKATQTQDWESVRIVVLIDDFSYLFELIVKKRLSPDFMKTFKAILQKNFFHVVLVGQDIMPKFKALCWLLRSSVHKTGVSHQYNHSHLPACLHEKVYRPENSRTGKPILSEYSYTYLIN